MNPWPHTVQKKFEILFVMVKVQFKVINACKFLVAVGFST